MKRAIILHGTQGHPDENWFRWLEKGLRGRGIDVWLPQLPHAERPALSQWYGFIEKNKPFAIDADTLIVGHSSGATLALFVAQKNPVPVGGLVAVSGFYNDPSLVANQWDANEGLFDVDFDWEAIEASTINRPLCVHSDDDPYIQLEHAKDLATKIGAEFVVLPGQGHFSLAQNEQYSEFSALLELMTKHGLL